MNSRICDALRIELSQPSAHYRLPYAYQRRLTYPLPSYSTVLGLLRNWIGLPEDKGERLPIQKIAIAGRSQARATEYTWLRNLSRDSKKDPLMRQRIYGFPEHPGKQSPVRVDTLEKVELTIYLALEKHSIDEIESALKEPRPYEILHLGRAEDLVIPENLSRIKLEKQLIPAKRYPYTFWVPYEVPEAVRRRLEGTLYRVALRCIENPTSASPNRQMEHVYALYWEGELGYSIKGYFDPEKKIPVFFQSL